MPPMPLLTATPSRYGSTLGEPASAQASRVATSASCSQRSIRRACTRPTTATGSDAAGAAIFTGSASAQDSVRRRTPLVPASIADQVDAASPPSGVVAPRPVTTTLTRSLLPTATSAVISRGDDPRTPDVCAGEPDRENRDRKRPARADRKLRLVPVRVV